MRLLALALAFAVCACGSSARQSTDDLSLARPARTSDSSARQAAVDDLDGESFESVGDTSACTDDCSGHDAGFEWARDQGITDESECGGNSRSFEEGCEAYAQAVEERTGESSSDDGDTDDGDLSGQLS